MSKPEIGRKILIAGLDEAGKTSILNTLHENYNLLDRIKPTVGYQLTSMKILGVPVVTYDLGGQAQFRNNYFSDSRLFTETDSLFFVIDAFEVSRYNEAFNYYNKILLAFKQFDLRPKIVLCIHKIDPNFRNDSKVPELVAQLREHIISMSTGFEVTSFTTTIYDRRTIVEAFSKTLQDLITILKPFKRVMEAVVKFLKLDGALLFDENFLIIGDSFLTPELEQKCLDILYNTIHSVKNVEIEKFELVLDSRSQEKCFDFIEVKHKDISMFLLTMGSKKVDHEVLTDKFISMCEFFEVVDYLK